MRDHRARVVTSARRLRGLLAWVLDLRRELGIPHTLADIGVTADQSALIGSEAAIDPSAGGNPIPVDAAALEKIFRAAVAGTGCDTNAGAPNPRDGWQRGEAAHAPARDAGL